MSNNPLYNLTAQKISFTYQNLLQTDGYGNYYNGLGDDIFIGGGTGYIGPTGPQGTQGPTGSDGVTGPQGTQGPTGSTGEQGIQGVTGEAGEAGPQGEKGFSTGLVYYFNPSIGATGATGYFDMSRDLITGGGTDKTASGSGDRLIASFVTKPSDPGITNIVSGNWNFETYVSLNSNGGVPSLFANIYYRNLDGIETLISSNTLVPKFITEGTVKTLYLWAIPVITTTVLETDRLVIKFYSRDLGGRTMTMHFEDTTIAQVTTSLSPSIQGATGPTGPTGETGPQGIQGVTGPSIILIRESDYVYPYQYSGTALFGTLTSSPTWEIKRIDFTTPGSPITLSATGAWDDRYILIYT